MRSEARKLSAVAAVLYSASGDLRIRCRDAIDLDVTGAQTADDLASSIYVSRPTVATEPELAYARLLNSCFNIGNTSVDFALRYAILWSSFSPGKCGSSRESDAAPAKARRNFWFRAGRRRTLIIFATREQACNPVAPQSRGERHMSPLCAERPAGGVHYRYRGKALCHFYAPFGPSDRRGSRLEGQGEDTNRAGILFASSGVRSLSGKTHWCRGTTLERRSSGRRLRPVGPVPESSPVGAIIAGQPRTCIRAADTDYGLANRRPA
jgi:hypothetical protein